MGIFSTLKKKLGLEVEITGDNRDIKSKLRETQGEVKRFTNKSSENFRQLQLMAVKFVSALAVGKFVKSSVQTAAFFEKTRIGFDVLTKSTKDGPRGVIFLISGAGPPPDTISKAQPSP